MRLGYRGKQKNGKNFLKKNLEIHTKLSTFAAQLNCGVEQLVARWAHNPKVVGSSPAPATKPKPVPAKVRAFCLINLKAIKRCAKDFVRWQNHAIFVGLKHILTL